ncbi:MAG: GNAT family N-acetyltransferase [Wenzhouxiangellaceae bacterium]
MNPKITHDPEHQRFETEVEGHRAVLEYRRQDAIADLLHVRVPSPIGGRGIAGQLTRTALEHAREAGWKVIPTCPYVRAWIDRHPDYADLVVGEA